MEKQIFKVGDKVFDFVYGWGEVVGIIHHQGVYPVHVKFNNEYIVYYTLDGKYGVDFPTPTLSFTEYELKGLSQERQINYEDYIGCWGLFWDNDDAGVKLLVELTSFNNNKVFKFKCKNGGSYKRFEPLTEEQLKALNLTNNK